MKTGSMDKRTRLASVVAMTVVAMAGVWFGLISPQKDRLQTLGDRKHKAAAKLQQVTATIKLAPQVESEVAEKTEVLQKLETGMASGDLYSWLITTVRQFKMDYKVEIPQFSQIDGPRDMTLLPSFPYKQVSVTIGGTGSYADIGKFISALENEFLYIRLVNLNLEPEPSSQLGESQNLVFKMDVVALVKPANSLLAKAK